MTLAAAALGVVFGFLIAWAHLTDPDVIRSALLLEDPYVFLLMFSALAVAFTGVRLLRRVQARALVTGERVRVETSPVQRRHVVGSAIFGLGWGISDSCPGPIAAQLAQGMAWSAFTIAGIAIGIVLYLRLQRVPAGETVAPGAVPAAE